MERETPGGGVGLVHRFTMGDTFDWWDRLGINHLVAQNE